MLFWTLRALMMSAVSMMLDAKATRSSRRIKGAKALVPTGISLPSAQELSHSQEVQIQNNLPLLLLESCS